jgi:hypothetical protein
MSDLKIKEENNIEERKEVKKSRKSYAQKNISTKKELVPTTVTFKNTEHRTIVTEYYKNIGFTTLNEYVMSLIKLSMNDDDITLKLKNIIQKNKA